MSHLLAETPQLFKDRFPEILSRYELRPQPSKTDETAKVTAPR
jgi:hypothetical protein